MRSIAAGLFAIAIAIVLVAVVLYASLAAPARCSAGGGDTGLPLLTFKCP